MTAQANTGQANAGQANTAASKPNGFVSLWPYWQVVAAKQAELTKNFLNKQRATFSFMEQRCDADADLIEALAHSEDFSEAFQNCTAFVQDSITAYGLQATKIVEPEPPTVAELPPSLE